MDIDLKNRLNIITMHLLIYDQLSSSKFNKIWRYSWYKSGYTNTHLGLFQNVIEVCFSSVRTHQNNAKKIVKKSSLSNAVIAKIKSVLIIFSLIIIIISHNIDIFKHLVLIIILIILFRV